MKFSDMVARLSVEAHSLTTATTLDPEVTGVAAIEDATPGCLSYVEGGRFANLINTTQASALVLPPTPELQALAEARGIAWMAVSNPRLTFAKAIALFYQPFQPAPAIHPTAVIDPTVKLGQGVSIGAHVVIQGGVTIGYGVCIHPNVVVYPGVTIGDRTILHANCVIEERTQIGTDCVIHSGAVIGSEGFGFVPVADGWFKMEQSGHVILEDHVEVGSNSTIDRPSVGTTRLGRHTKLDNLVHVAHGCQIGEACAMAAQVGLAGGVETGKRVILGGQVGVANLVHIGDGAQAGAKAGLHGNVAPGEIVMGSPAIPYKLFLKTSAVINRLPDMHRAIKHLQKQLGLDA